MNAEYERHKPLWDYVSDCYEGSANQIWSNALSYLPMLWNGTNCACAGRL